MFKTKPTPRIENECPLNSLLVLGTHLINIFMFSNLKTRFVKKSASSNKVRQVTIGVAPTLRTASRTRTPSGSNTPVHPDQQTAVSKLLRRPSGASDTATGQAAKKKSSIADREPFRL
ncbi:hypothetical protein NQ315_006901 [Exocentrus adspersus]|uniref:Uncharacterized protein n=1 Tax=Exocentrus adspersus TaxID=1586481 RepID=A0AAV8WC91_9CUCU|nr:hypothetical protein NQ315_006901 [Exocentrus adspersus]